MALLARPLRLLAPLVLLLLAIGAPAAALAQDPVAPPVAVAPADGVDAGSLLGDAPDPADSDASDADDDGSADGDADGDDDDTSAVSGCATKRAVDDGDGGSASGDSADAASGDDDGDATDAAPDSDANAEDAPGCDGSGSANAKGTVLSLAAVRKSGRLDAGVVHLKAAGRLVQTVTAGCSARPKRVRTVYGRAAGSVSAPGDVHLSITFNRQGRAMLHHARGKVCVTLSTRIVSRGKPARTTRHTVWLGPAVRGAAGS